MHAFSDSHTTFHVIDPRRLVVLGSLGHAPVLVSDRVAELGPVPTLTQPVFAPTS